MPRYQSFTVRYIVISVYFGILFSSICLSLFCNLHFPSVIFTICTFLMTCYLVCITYSFSKENKHDPNRLKSLIFVKIRFYIYLFSLTVLYFLVFIPMGFIEIFLELCWLFSLVWVGGSFIFEMEYLLDHLPTGTVEDISKFHLFYFLAWLCNYAFGYFLFYYYGRPDIPPDFRNIDAISRVCGISLLFLSGTIIMLCLFDQLGDYHNIKNSKNQTQLKALQQSFILSTKFHIFVVLPTLITNIILPLLYLPQFGYFSYLNILLSFLFFGDLYKRKKLFQKFSLK